MEEIKGEGWLGRGMSRDQLPKLGKPGLRNYSIELICSDLKHVISFR
jgi:hypothetical protein